MKQARKKVSCTVLASIFIRFWCPYFTVATHICMDIFTIELNKIPFLKIKRLILQHRYELSR